MKIIPAILATSEEQYREELEKIEQSNFFDWVHIDLIDNQFTQNQSIGLEILKKYPTGLKIEVHLMVEEPLKWFEVEMDRLIVHSEIGQDRISQLVTSTQRQVFLAFNPETELIETELPGLLIMGVHPGFQGQEFIPGVLEKIKQARGMGKIVGVDGGITSENAKLIVEAGADYLVVGSHILKGDINENIQQIQNSIG